MSDTRRGRKRRSSAGFPSRKRMASVPTGVGTAGRKSLQREDKSKSHVVKPRWSALRALLTFGLPKQLAIDLYYCSLAQC